jgi:hypothetical protein
MGLTAREARAANLTMTLTWTGGSLTFDNTSAQALPGSSVNSLLVDTNAVNTYLSTHGSAITFSALGASSNFPGGVPIPTQATLNETGTAVLASSTGATSITIAVSQAGFTTPSGTGATLNSGQTAIFTNMAAGASESSSSSYNATNTPTLTSTSLGTQLQVYSPSNSLGIASVVSGYSLDNSATINFGASTPGPGTTDQFAVAATLAAAVPEPASLLLMLTGLPMPLVVMGLLRRRRGAA